MPGFEAMQRQQQAFLETMMAGWTAMPGRPADKDKTAETESRAAPTGKRPSEAGEDLSEIRRQLAALEAKLSKMDR
jgi:hypothetical protein